MGPITLFDKSFLQSLTVDESVWFGHFFHPVVCPIFYVETLADLEKRVRDGRTQEQEVRIIASKFPDQSADPCAFHGTLLVDDLLGSHIPMDGRIPLPGGRPVAKGEKRGYIFERSPEFEAFSRWQREEFLDIERFVAKGWRATLNAIDLGALASQLHKLGISSRTCKTLEDARTMARAVISASGKHFAVAALLHQFANIPSEASYRFLEAWSIKGYPILKEYAPYAAHVLSVELFFQFALAGGLIGTERSSNRVDIAYLNYLPFCMVFVSSDRLHQRCAPFFLRENQQFVWGPSLKQDLGRINAYFSELPEAERERGITTFAHAPPPLENSIVRALRARFMGARYDDRPPIPAPPEDDPKSKQLIAEFDAWQDAPEAAHLMRPDGDDADMMMIKRSVRKKRGSWWQLPKGLKNKDHT